MTSTPNLKYESSSSPQHTAARLVTGRLGTARSRWNDYRGTVAADDSIARLDSRSLYEIVGLDRGRWTIVGVDASLADTSERVVVFALDRTLEPDANQTQLEVGVTAFHLDPSTRVDQFLHEASQRVPLRLVSTLAADCELRVDGHIDLPSQ